MAKLKSVSSSISSDSLHRLFWRGAAGAGFVHGISLLAGLLAQLILARRLGTAAYGHFILAWTWALFLALPCRLGFQSSLVRFVTDYRIKEDWSRLRGVVTFSFWAVLICGSLAGGVLYFSAGILSGNLSSEQFTCLRLAAFAIPPMALMGVAHAALKAYRRVVVAQLAQRGLIHIVLLALVVFSVLAGILADAGQAARVAVASAWISFLVAIWWIFGTLSPQVKRAVPTFNGRRWMTISLPMLVVVATQTVMNQTDTLMLGALANSELAGLYSVASRLSQLATFGLIAANAIAAPVIAELFRTEKHQELQRFLTIAAWSVGLFTLAISVCFLVFGGEMLNLFGAEFRKALVPLFILLVGHIANAITGPVGLMLTLTGHQNFAARLLGIGALVNVLLNGVLIPPFGVNGAAIASAITIAGVNVIMLVTVRSRLGFSTSIFSSWWRPPSTGSLSADQRGRQDR